MKPLVVGSIALAGLLLIGGLAAGVMWFGGHRAETPVAGAPPATPSEATANEAAQVEEPVSVGATPEFREVDLPESVRRNIYRDIRAAARSTIEKKLMIPKGSPPRIAMEQTLKETFERELRRFAALHDVTVEEIKQIRAEGDAKGWDPARKADDAGGDDQATDAGDGGRQP